MFYIVILARNLRFFKHFLVLVLIKMFIVYSYLIATIKLSKNKTIRYNIFDNFFIIAQARECLGTPHFRGFFSLLRRQRGVPHMRGTPLFYSRSIRPVLFLIIILYITHVITVAL